MSKPNPQTPRIELPAPQSRRKKPSPSVPEQVLSMPFDEVLKRLVRVKPEEIDKQIAKDSK